MLPCTALLLLLTCLSTTAQAVMRSTFTGLQASEADELLSFLQGQLGTPKTDGDDESDPANVLIKYLVPPPVQKEFIEVFKGVKDETKKEEGCKDYYLLKPITDNITYYIFGRWTSKEAYADHFKSDHTKRLLEFDQDKGIVFYIQPLLVVD